MKRLQSGQVVLVGLTCIAVGIVAADVWRLFSADVQARWEMHVVTGGLFASLPFVEAAIMVPFVLVKRAPQARRALIRMFAVIVVGTVSWWIFAATSPSGLSPERVVFVRFCRFVLMPALYAATLYVPSVTRYLGQSTESRHQNGEEAAP
jgi:hypothetical protein